MPRLASPRIFRLGIDWQLAQPLKSGGHCKMRTPTAYVATLVLGFAAFGLGQNLQVPRALAADCS